ncbi:MAG: SDR family oxidoreductase, partial [Pseudomonadota bacterium]|nr:SDR family oxidoreductase [Pseudomonadota bacterium]
ATPFRGLANYSMYATGRGAGHAMVKSLSLELAPPNIQINLIAPDYIQNPTYFPPSFTENEAAMAKMLANIPARSLGAARRSRRIDRIFRVGQMRVRDGTRGPYLRRLGLVGGNLGEASKLGSFGAFVCISGALVARLRNNKGG